MRAALVRAYLTRVHFQVQTTQKNVPQPTLTSGSFGKISRFARQLMLSNKASQHKPMTVKGLTGALLGSLGRGCSGLTHRPRLYASGKRLSLTTTRR